MISEVVPREHLGTRAFALVMFLLERFALRRAAAQLHRAVIPEAVYHSISSWIVIFFNEKLFCIIRLHPLEVEVLELERLEVLRAVTEAVRHRLSSSSLASASDHAVAAAA